MGNHWKSSTFSAQHCANKRIFNALLRFLLTALTQIEAIGESITQIVLLLGAIGG